MAAADPAFDLDASPVPGQSASCVLDLEGKIIRGQLGEKQAALLYQMLVECGNLNLNSLGRITVSLSSVRYAITRDANHIYIAQMRL